MKKTSGILLILICLLFSLTGCSAIGSKAESMVIIYDLTAIISFLLMIGYCCLIRKKDIWFLLLFASVFVVNIGYLTLAHSRNLDEALLANRVAYLGSVCLPMSMLMIIMNTCGLKYKKWFPGLLLGVGTAVFLIAASPGYLDIYYKEVSLATVNGVSVLEKVYGPLHCINLFYLLACFALTSAVIIHAAVRKKIASPTHVVILAAAVLVNMGVLLLEQLVRIDFELLSVSYIISELFLLCLCMLLQEGSAAPDADRDEAAVPAIDAAEPWQAKAPAMDEPPAEESKEQRFHEKCSYFASQLPFLTPTEHIIYELYIAGTSTKEIMAELNIKENTLKYHNKNIYGKLGVSSRKQLMEIASALKKAGGAIEE